MHTTSGQYGSCISFTENTLFSANGFPIEPLSNRFLQLVYKERHCLRETVFLFKLCR
jgi:hypothetical protein